MNLTVQQALTNRNWIRGLQRISSTAQLQQFVRLWTLLQQVQLSEQPNEVCWRFTASGKYSSKSAYIIQFAGIFADHSWMGVWRAKVEEKCKIFFWLILQNRLLDGGHDY
jgi:hypothetical protein